VVSKRFGSLGTRPSTPAKGRGNPWTRCGGTWTILESKGNKIYRNIGTRENYVVWKISCKEPKRVCNPTCQNIIKVKSCIPVRQLELYGEEEAAEGGEIRKAMGPKKKKKG